MNINIKSVHPFADAFPMMTDEEMTRLVDDIKQHGQIEPCIVNSQGVLLDGRNRRAACERLGIEPRVRYENPESETAFILSSNVARRHLSASQLGVIALESLPHFEAEARERQGTRLDLVAPVPPSAKRLARDEAAKAVGISGRTVAQAKRVAEQAPELLEEVKVGNLTLKAAEKRLKQNLETVQWMRDERIGDPDPAPVVTSPVDPDPLDLAFLEGAAARLTKVTVTWTNDAERTARAERALTTISTHLSRLHTDNRRTP